MSLINCCECGYEFSDKAHACPKCGCPKTPGGMTPITLPTPAIRKRKMAPLKIGVVVLLAILLLPLSMLVGIGILQALNDMLWQLSYVLPSWLVGPFSIAVFVLPLLVGVVSIWWLTKLLQKGR